MIVARSCEIDEKKFVEVACVNVAAFAKRLPIFAFPIDDDAAVVVTNVVVEVKDAGEPVVKLPETKRLVAVAFEMLAPPATNVCA